MVSKAVEQILELGEGTRLASQDPLVREWNIDVLDRVVQNVVANFPQKPSEEDLEIYGQLREKMEQFSEQFGDARFTAHVLKLREKIATFQKGKIYSIQSILRHPLTEKIVGFQRFHEEESPSWFRLKLMGYIRNELIPVILNVKTNGEHEWLHPILEGLVSIGQALEPYDLDSAYDDEMRAAVKQFLFKGVVTHPIYQNLLAYQEKGVDRSNKDLCVEAAEGINAFITQYLVPFLKDPDVEPSHREIETITYHLVILNEEFSLHQKNLFRSSIKVLKSFL
ncbi:MAG: hypothetical protein KDK64_03415 [Chlamydiia bacterium]|nr:hypothetical protein [Chlamydiia bacterium]